MLDNLTVYNSKVLVDFYKEEVKKGLQYQEKYCLDRVPEKFKDSILDIAIGAGRTTAVLSKMFNYYVGVDYSPTMVEAAKTFFPNLDLRVMDARKIEFVNEFDCVMFSYNGINYTKWEERPEVFMRISRALKKGGYFIFSTKNLICWRVPRWYNLLLDGKTIWTWRPERRPWWRPPVRPILRRMRWFWLQRYDKEGRYAYINDWSNGYRLLTTYTDVERELAGFDRYHFEVLVAIGNNKTEPGFDSDDEWVYVLARKTDAPDPAS